ncbi:MAG: Fic/DOC family protein [Candidatus Methanoperedens nitroreducens]|uniref:Fic/DOC family protein n=1 Tax=Candidatus Methanoperedens nitratireducens TaxID=1392998 RepID=A0A0P7ZF94_9EURY|nr:MAG: Fic/DOC family protein [Candidatus Methanoperedens sp. BLZ1]
MSELTTRKIIEIHDDIIKNYGGTRGVLSEATLDMLVYAVNRENDVFKKAALVLHRIASQHPFFDGNKRTALVTAEKILYDEGYHIHAGPDEKVVMMLRIAKYNCSIKAIEKWVRENAREL